MVRGKRDQVTKMRKEQTYLGLPDLETVTETLVSVPGMRNLNIWTEHRCCAEENDQFERASNKA